MARPRKYNTSEEQRLAQLAGSNRWKERNREHTREYGRQQYRKNCTSFEGYCIHFIKSINSRQGDTDIDLDYLLDRPQKCAITNRNFEYQSYHNTFSNPLAPSIDRIDSSKGYYKGNIQIVLNCINKMKNDMPDEAFRDLWKELREWPAS